MPLPLSFSTELRADFLRESATSLAHTGMQGVEVWKVFSFSFHFFFFLFFFLLFFHFQSILCPSIIIFPFFSFFLFFLLLSLSLFLGILYIFKGIIYKAFCLLNVFLFVMQLFISTCCDAPQLDFFFKSYM